MFFNKILNDFVISKDTQNYDEILGEICQSFTKLIKENSSEERLIVPLYKTLDYLFESEEFARWKNGLMGFSNDLLAIISQEVTTSKSIGKLLALSGLSVGVFIYVSKENKKNSFSIMGKLLTHK